MVKTVWEIIIRNFSSVLHKYLQKYRETVVVCLICFASLLVLLDLTLNTFKFIHSENFHNVFNLANENSLGTWFSSHLASLIALSCFCMSLALRKGENLKFIKNPWFYFGLVFLYLSMDDVAEIHERGGTLVKNLLTEMKHFSEPVEIYPSYFWQVTWGPIIGILLLSFAFFLWKSHQSNITHLILMGLFCFIVAFFLDFVEGLDGFEDFSEKRAKIMGWKSYWVEHIPRLLEEYLEILGLILFFAVSSKSFENEIERHLEN